MAEDLVEDFQELPIEDKIALVKSAVTFPEVVELLGFEIDTNNKIPSPYNPDERTPSFHCYSDHGYDFASGQSTDVIDFVQLLDPSLSLSQAVWLLRNRAIRAGKQAGDVEAVRPRELLDFSPDLPQGPARQVVNELLGLPVRPYGLLYGPGGDVLIPHSEPGHVYGVKVRQTDGRKISWPGSAFSHRLYCPMGWPDRQPSQAAVICEGESDAWALLSVLSGVDVFALPSGSATWKDHWLEDLRPYGTIWLAMDHDRAGVQALAKLTTKIGYGRARELRFPTLENDIRAAVSIGWVPDAAALAGQ